MACHYTEPAVKQALDRVQTLHVGLGANDKVAKGSDFGEAVKKDLNVSI